MDWRRIVCLTAAGACLLAGSCRTAYYSVMEKMGRHKRDLLVGAVASARSSQGEAKAHFKDALEQFSAVVHFEGGDLEALYTKLSRSFERSEADAREVHGRIDEVETVADDLFAEWRRELKQYTSDSLRRESKRQYDTTLSQYRQMLAAMRKSATSMDPVLDAFRDQVLFLKHNLNSRAIAGIEQEAAKVEADVARLIREMEASIAEADAFLRSMGVGDNVSERSGADRWGGAAPAPARGDEGDGGTGPGRGAA